MRRLGQLLQFVGLAVLPIAMVMELSGSLGREFGLAELLIALVFGIVVFYAGRIIEGYAG